MIKHFVPSRAIKSPCDDCHVRLAAKCPTDPITLTPEANNQISDSLEWRLFFPDTPLPDGAEEGAGKALDRCDHWHRWGQVVCLSAQNITDLMELKKSGKRLVEFTD